MSGTNRNAINKRLPAPATAARTKPKSVGTVLEAKMSEEKPTSIIIKVTTLRRLAPKVLLNQQL